MKTPSEVWVVRREDGDLLPPMDDDGTHAFMAWPSRDEAEKGLKHQQATWDLDDVKLTVEQLM